MREIVLRLKIKEVNNMIRSIDDESKQKYLSEVNRNF